MARNKPRRSGDRQRSQSNPRRASLAPQLPRVVLALSAQANAFLLAAVVLAGFGATWLWAGPGPDRLAIAIAPLGLTFPMLVVGLVLTWFARGYRKRAQTLLNGPCEGRWNIPDDVWQAFHNHQVRKTRLVVPVSSVIGLLLGIGIVWIAWQDRAALVAGAEPLTVFLVAGAAGAFVGAVSGGFLQYLIRLPNLVAARQPGLVVLGDDGYYLPGTFRPWRAYGQILKQADVVPGTTEQPCSQLVITFLVTAKHGYRKDIVPLPIPPGHDADGQRIADWINNRFGTA